ncbi:hypothetical protein N7526_003419 [Penicillium atrosanguineum]|nr:hypothetical protein N7526_003419 [Penicillium atrosanguineum]
MANRRGMRPTCARPGPPVPPAPPYPPVPPIVPVPSSPAPAKPVRSFVGLDANNNPITETFHTVFEYSILDAPVLSSVDWRGDNPRDCKTIVALRAARIYQSAAIAPVGELCDNCARGSGPFVTCRVLVYGGVPFNNGGCTNCNFSGNGTSCSFRSTPTLPEWVLTLIRA